MEPIQEITREHKKELRIKGLARCNGISELSEENGYVETSHLNHDKTDVEIYLSDDVVVMCTPLEHYAYHLMFKDKAHLIGLNEQQNEFAIQKTFDRAVYYLDKHKDIDFNSLTREDKISLISQAWNFWSYYLELPFYDE